MNIVKRYIHLNISLDIEQKILNKSTRGSIGLYGLVNIHWGVGTGAKSDRTYTFYVKIIIELELFSTSAMIG